MADVKISALPAATIPLVGTEVLPIVQGTSTVKVANNNLRPKQIQSNATSGVLQVTGPAAASTRVMTTPDANFTAARTDAAQSFTGNQTLSDGNLIIGTSGKGIDFSATSDGSGTATSELLADYEEGTWTPVLTLGGAAVGMTGTFTGNYTKFGRAVLVYGRILLTAKGSSTGNMSITGLPYTSIDNSSGIADPSAGMAGLTAGGAIPMGISSTTVYMFLQTTTSRNLLTDANFTNTSDIRFSLVYNT